MTTSENVIVNDNSWENLGEVSIFSYSDRRQKGTGSLLYKYVHGLGHRFKLLYGNKVYALSKNMGIRNQYDSEVGMVIIEDIK